MTDVLQRGLADPVARQLLVAILGILIILILVRLFQRSLTQHISHSETRYRARKLITFAAYLVAILFVSIVFRDQLGHLTVALGVATAGVAFALQEVITSFAGWVAISFGRFYQIGDRVQVGGIIGDVIDIGMLRTTLMECGAWVNSDLYNGRIVRIANGLVFTEPVYNYSADLPFLWDEITVPVKYGSDHRLARDILQRAVNDTVGDHTARAREAWRGVVKRYMIEPEQVEPMITLIANDNWMEFTVRYVVDYKQRRFTKDQIFERILEELEGTKDAVAIASTTVHVVETPAFDVRLNRGETYLYEHKEGDK